MSEVTQRRLTVVYDGRARDVVADAGLALAELVAMTRVGEPVVPTTLDGVALDLDRSVGANGLGDGDLLVLTPTNLVPAPVAAEKVEAASGRRATTSAGVLAGVALLLCSVLAVVAAVLAPGQGVSHAVGGLLLGLAAVLSLSDVRSRVAPARAVAPGVAAAASALLAYTIGMPDGLLVVAAGGIGAAAVAVLGWGHAGLGRRLPKVWMVLGLSVAGLAVVGALFAWPLSTAGLVLVAVGPLLARWLPSRALHVEEDALLEIDRLSATAWTARPRAAGTRRRLRVEPEQVHRTVAESAAEIALTWAVLGPLMVAAATYALARQGSQVGLVAAVVGVAGLALSLSARSYLRRRERDLLRVVGVLLVGTSVGSVVLAEPSWSAAALALTIALGVLALALTPAVGRGWTSLTLGRVADLAETLSIVAVLPLTAVAAGLLTWTRHLTS